MNIIFELVLLPPRTAPSFGEMMVMEPESAAEAGFIDSIAVTAKHSNNCFMTLSQSKERPSCSNCAYST